MIFKLGFGFCPAVRGAESRVELPAGVQAVWDLRKAFHETTPTRERVCLNGLWEWQPSDAQAKEVPENNWGFFKVPGSWPGITDYMQKDCQSVYVHPNWRSQKLGGITAAWYQRDFVIPPDWANRRVCLSIEWLNSFAEVYVDGIQLGEVRFPGGEVDLNSAVKDGRSHRLSLLVVALPLKAVMLSYADSASARSQKGHVAFRGLCGDLYLVAKPEGPGISDLRVETSVRSKELTLNVALTRLDPEKDYQLKGSVLDGTNVVKEVVSGRFRVKDLKDGRFAFSQTWLPEKLWDINTPENQFTLEASLLDSAGQAVDGFWRTRFGFRELWIQGRDFYLNGSRIFLSAVPLDNAQVNASLATYARAKESLERLKSFGINFVYTHNYGCQPGVHLGFEEILRAADDVGMLVSFSQPHFSHYDWKASDADRVNGYARHAAYYVRSAQNHPAVVMYSMSHNATGYEEDMNPDMIDGVQASRDSWAAKNVVLASRADAIVHQLDPTRIVYHHASGNLGAMHSINFYPNFVPIQELSDWFEHWSTQGTKPVFLCEYGAPFTWDWAMYRGWYKGQREFGSAAVPWEFCLAEWNAQFLGDAAFRISDSEKRNLRWEAEQFRAGKLWHRWDYPVDLNSTRLEERYPVFAMYLKDNWRAFRTWEVSGNSPWEHAEFWKLRDGTPRARRDYQTDWESLQRPGFSPDYEEQRYERMDLAYQRSDWIPTAAAQVLIANNQPLLAYIAGRAGAFTSKDHLFQPGETVSKQLTVINNSRRTVTVDCEWSFDGPGAAKGTDHFTLATGRVHQSPIAFELPGSPPAGPYELIATARFSDGSVQTDRFTVDLISKPNGDVARLGKVALFDPVGDTAKLLGGLGVKTDRIEPNTDLAPYDLLIVGKMALKSKEEAPDISRVKEGLKVIIFEQTSEVLEKRFGFRVSEYGLRQVFPRIAGHAALTGLGLPQLRDWRGEATIVPPRVKYQLRPQYGPTVEWCGLLEPHLWRCGNRGNVASVLIEKPTKGDFLPILDGGFSLQFSPLLQYREGRGMVLFCQMDVTSRTEREPAADLLVQNILRYVSGWSPPARRQLIYAGEAVGKDHLRSLGLTVEDYERSKLTPGSVLALGAGSSRELVSEKDALGAWLKTGGRVISVGLSGDEINGLLPVQITTRKIEHISAFFDPFNANSPFSGIGAADLHNRDPRQFPLLSRGAEIIGDGVLGQASGGNIVFCQIVPWQFDDSQPNLKRTHRRVSFAFSRLLANMGVAASTPLLERFRSPAGGLLAENRWLSGFYLDVPQEWDDPYRHFRW